MKLFCNNNEVLAWMKSNCDSCCWYVNNKRIEDSYICKSAKYIDRSLLSGDIPPWVGCEIGIRYDEEFGMYSVNDRCLHWYPTCVTERGKK